MWDKPACVSDTALRLVGSFGGSEAYPFDDIAVNPARDTLYAVVRGGGGTFDGIYRFTYPGLVNTQGAGLRWAAEGAGEDWGGLTVDPSGNVYVGAVTNAGPPHTESIYKFTPSAVKTTFDTRSRATNGALTLYRIAWSTVDNCILGVGQGAGDSSGHVVSITGSGFTDLETVTSGGSSCVAITPDGALWFIGTISGTSHVVRKPSGSASSNAGITAIASGAILVAGQPDNRFLFQTGAGYDGKISTTALVVTDDDRGDTTRVFACHTSLDAKYVTAAGTGSGHNDDIYELKTCS